MAEEVHEVKCVWAAGGGAAREASKRLVRRDRTPSTAVARIRTRRVPVDEAQEAGAAAREAVVSVRDFRMSGGLAFLENDNEAGNIDQHQEPVARHLGAEHGFDKHRRGRTAGVRQRPVLRRSEDAACESGTRRLSTAQRKKWVHIDAAEYRVIRLPELIPV